MASALILVVSYATSTYNIFISPYIGTSCIHVQLQYLVYLYNHLFYVFSKRLQDGRVLPLRALELPVPELLHLAGRAPREGEGELLRVPLQSGPSPGDTCRYHI